jgi:hypothetical protein
MNRTPPPSTTATPTEGSITLKYGYDSGVSGPIYLQISKPHSYEVYPPLDTIKWPDLHTKFLTAKEMIEELAALPENWDGYGALGISAETTLNALKALDAFLDDVPTPEITPSPNGTLSFEWESPRGVAHLEIGRTRFSFYIKPLIGDPIITDGRVEQLGYNLGRLVTQHLFPAQCYTSTTPDARFEKKSDPSQGSFTITPAAFAKAS